MNLPRHGGPEDRGSADAYYGRPYRPHYFRGPSYHSERIDLPNLTDAEIEEYRKGYRGEEDRKDWN